MVSTNNSTEINHTLIAAILKDMEHQQWKKDLYAIVILGMLSVVGTVGNIHTLLVYLLSPVNAKLSIRVFILWLSSIDLIASFLCVPFEIFDIRYPYTFSSGVACKIFRFLTYTTTLTSGGLLVVISIERYWKCIKGLNLLRNRPFLKQNIICVTILVISISISIPLFVFNGLNEIETDIPGVKGTDCAILSNHMTMTNAIVYGGLIILLGTIGAFVCFFVYGKILLMICTQVEWDKGRKIYQNTESAGADSTLEEITETSFDSVSKNSSAQIPRSNQTASNEIRKKSKPVSQRSGYEKGKKLTISIMVATLISYTSYIVHVVFIVIGEMSLELYHETIGPVGAFFMRAFFISSAANPVIYILVDPTFRSECKKLYKCECKRKESSPFSKTPAH